MSKPPYAVPLMQEIRDIPWNGFNVVSTFSGCGGSCLGYRMAGFRVLWASEFIPAAQAVYKLNHPDSILDLRDIRQVQPGDILEATGLAEGELDLLDGSPPCASFSTSGSRESGWGKVKKYSDTQQRTDDLFFEYARLVRGLRPKVFVAENVSGLIKGAAKGYFKMILAELKSCGYRVSCRVLDAQWLGVPQQRQRTIFVGVREDLGLDPVHPDPLPYRYTVADALPWIQTVTQDPKGQFPVQVVHTKTDPMFTVTVTNRNHVTVDADPMAIDEEASNAGYAIAAEYERLRQGESSDKYLNLCRTAVNKPSYTVTQTAGQRGAAGVCHPLENRKFYIGELKRISGFPDDFQLAGTFAQRWERIGRSVPPVMMSHIAAAVRDRILIPSRG